MAVDGPWWSGVWTQPEESSGGQTKECSGGRETCSDARAERDERVDVVRCVQPHAVGVAPVRVNWREGVAQCSRASSGSGVGVAIS